jgi:5,6-dimethylbenzimidazole synthase
VVRDQVTRDAFHHHVQQERDVFTATLDPHAAARLAHIKIEGAPGRHAIAALYSVCLAIQNLWLAATAEGLGVG